MANSSVSLKLLIDTQSKRVLFAEAGKDCVDFLFYILSLPVAKLISLLGKQGMVGSLGNLYMQVSDSEGGFVKGVVTYMVMDDLVVKPMSTISSITLLNKFNVKEVGALEEKVVNLGMNEVVKLLKAALETKNVLTRVYLNA
ncbi:hypothetical protein PHJA_001772400 [Phtheirospermum japonicum]|uniref:Uncharacterized protein n=1 Tax=Phtheirospermum japonicum TaxID=374723 RepID=A0A830CKE1_9LAMI|nr:hypothetical protein PHJA_001772400 [Phtheirospermum japonicum]